MNDAIFNRLRNMFDVPNMQNNLRGLWAEAMIAELLGGDWQHKGGDWAAWDLERGDGLRVEIKQSARQQSWGKSLTPPRFGIAAAKGHYPDGKTYVVNTSGARFADVYIFAWHDGADQRDLSEWLFYVVAETLLPRGKKSIALSAIQRLTEPVSASDLRERLASIPTPSLVK